jgi:hypothetical protein
MGCLGVHFAIMPDQEAKLLAVAGDDEAVLGVIEEEIEAAWDQEWLCETDKAWDAIHRCLTDGSLSVSGGEDPLRLCILGGRQLYQGDDYFVCFVPASKVPQVSAGLDAFSREMFDQAYDALDQTDYDGPIGLDDREYTREYLSALKVFWRKAADAGRSVVFTVDQ